MGHNVGTRIFKLALGPLDTLFALHGTPPRDPTHECKWGFQVEVWLQHKNQNVKGDPILSKVLS
jgi:hypothetical protein